MKFNYLKVEHNINLPIKIQNTSHTGSMATKKSTECKLYFHLRIEK